MSYRIARLRVDGGQIPGGEYGHMSEREDLDWRRQRVLDQLLASAVASEQVVAAIATKFGAPAETIRRDLEVLRGELELGNVSRPDPEPERATEPTPLASGEIRRGEAGRFLPGNPPGPMARPGGRTNIGGKRREYLRATMRGCSVEDWAHIVRVAVSQAKRGHAKARQFLGEYLLPPPRFEVRGKVEVEQRRVDVLALIGDPARADAALQKFEELAELMYARGPGETLAGGTGDPDESRSLEAGPAPLAAEPEADRGGDGPDAAPDRG